MSDANAPEAGLRCGFVALIGWTNVGKSTLLNRLVGAKLAAVADAAQTTRYPIRGVRNLTGAGQVIFVDTPGIHQPRHKLNRAMVDRTRQAVQGVDLVALVVDAARDAGRGDATAVEWVRRAGRGHVVVLNKIDRVRPKTRLLEWMRLVDEEWGLGPALPVSARSGEGCDELLRHLLSRLPPQAPLFDDDYLTDEPMRSLAAEWIREKLLGETRDELCHAMAVQVERWHQRTDGLVEIEAAILVDRPSQKKIVIGRGGELLKRVGTAARVDLEELLQQRVFLSLWVQVRQDWRDDTTVLRELGLG